MAERSFAEEVKKLRLGAGETFHGEGILAVTKALLQSGVAYVGGYQGAPIRTGRARRRGTDCRSRSGFSVAPRSR